MKTIFLQGRKFYTVLRPHSFYLNSRNYQASARFACPAGQARVTWRQSGGLSTGRLWRKSAASG
jgi:hypothetical protein